MQAVQQPLLQPQTPRRPRQPSPRSQSDRRMRTSSARRLVPLHVLRAAARVFNTSCVRGTPVAEPAFTSLAERHQVRHSPAAHLRCTFCARKQRRSCAVHSRMHVCIGILFNVKQ